jgi:hypothetical protein
MGAGKTGGLAFNAGDLRWNFPSVYTGTRELLNFKLKVWRPTLRRLSVALRMREC